MSDDCCQIKVTQAEDCLRIEIPGKHLDVDVSGCKISVCRESEGSASECCKEDKGQGGPKGCC